jgi:glycosyltransferase involved in cell wall biosynthesis
VQVVNTQRRERSFARNVGAAIARGKYYLFLDDDDWLQPGAIQKLYDLSLRKTADIYYGGFNFIVRPGNSTLEIQSDEEGNVLVRLMVGEWLPIGTFMVASHAFFRLNGFDPEMAGGEDTDLMIKLAHHNQFAVTQGAIANICRDHRATTTDYSDAVAKFRKSRERCLSLDGTYQRLRESANSRPVRANYWKGKVSAIYFASVVWNLKHRHLVVAFKRACSGLANMLGSGQALFTSDFWYSLNPRRPKGHLNSR